MATANFNHYFPDYEILGELGRSNARVLKAKHKQTGQLVAIKHFAFNTDADTIRRFQRESEIMTSIDHPNVVRIHEVRFDADLPYIVMELIEGGDVRSLLKKDTYLDVATTIRLGLQMADALKMIHDRGIIHRDIKPDNIMYRRLQSGELHFLLTDFGIAKLREQSNTVTGQSLMTYEYASPEQFDNPKGVDAATDYYSLGVVFYECLSGKVPFSIDELGMRKFMHSVVEVPPPALASVTSQPLPEGLDELIMGLLSKDVSERIKEIDQLVFSLEQARFNSVLLRMGKTDQRSTTGKKKTTVQPKKSPSTQPSNQETVPATSKKDVPATPTKKVKSGTSSKKETLPPAPKNEEVPPPPNSDNAEKQLTEADQFYRSQHYEQALALYMKAALQGSASAQLSVGHMYESGLGVTKDYQQAFTWYQKAALQGNATAQNLLGHMYYFGKGMAQNYQPALALYQKSANQDNGTGQFMLALMYENGFGVPKNIPEAIKWYQKAAQANKPNQKEAITALKRLESDTTAANDSTKLIVSADQQYNQGNYADALKLYLEAAKQGHAIGQLSVGHMHESGLGTAKDYKQAFPWYQKAALQGNETAQNKLGWFYEKGNGIAQDYQQALYWYQKSADRGNATGQNSLGHLYYFGNGVTRDYAKARQLYQKAADQHNGTGQFMLGLMHEHGYGVPKNIPEAIKWYQLAAQPNQQNQQDALNALKRLGVDNSENKPKKNWFSSLFGEE